MSLVQKTARLAARSLGHNSWLIRQLRPTYETLLDVAGGGQGIFWEINGVPYRIDPHQRHRLGQNYDAPVAAFLRERVKPGAICLDVGANVGIYVLQFAHWSAPNGRVIAFEPNPEACAVLENHIYLNHLSSRVTVVPAAVGAESGEAELFAAEADGMSRLGAPNQLIAERVTKLNVPVVTLDEYCEEWGIEPDWLFMDIEGLRLRPWRALSG